MPIPYDYPWSKLVRELTSHSEPLLVCTRRGIEISPDSLDRAKTLLESDPDIALVGRRRDATEVQDVAGFLDGEAFVVSMEPLRRLIESGFRPIYNLAELPCALRHAGWRVLSLDTNFSDTRAAQDFQRGRELAVSRVYELGLERMLASGPRLLRLSPIWDLEMARRENWSWKTRVGFVGQLLKERAKGEVAKRFRATWRASGTFQQSLTASKESDTQIILFTANRPWYLRRALRAVADNWPHDAPPRLAISQDGNDIATESLATSFGKDVELWKFQEPVKVPRKQWMRGQTPYFRIAQHYKYAINRAFEDPTADRVIILEDDLEIGADFFPYLKMCDELLKEYADLLGASAWNDHGQWAKCAQTVHRTDCFPGNGWMLHRSHWDYFGSNWPEAYWDEWIRDPALLQGRQFLRPEMSRTRNFGRTGTGSTEFFDNYIAPVKFQDEEIAWSEVSVDLEYSDYIGRLLEQVAKARLVEKLELPLQSNVKFVYHDKDSFNDLAKKLGILPGFRPHAPRAAFEGVVILRMGEFECFVVPRALAGPLP